MFFPFLSAGKGDIYEGFKIIKLYYSIHGTRLENASAAPALCQVGGLAVSGRVHAGFPSPAEEELLDTMSLDEYLIENKEATFILKVSGNSMIDAGIMPQDLVLVERTNEAKPGDIVIAEVDGKWTMKYLRQKGSRMYLEPANKKYAPIYPEEELKISAVVKAVIRKY